MNEKLPGLFKCKVRPLTKEESEMYIRLTLAEMGGNDEYFAGLDKHLREKGVFPYMVMVHRLEAFKENFNPKLDIGIALQVFLASICDRPGKVVMWAHTLNEMFVKLGHKVTMGDWANEFPMGVPTDEEYKRVWELQKITPPPGIIGGDNLIDDFKAWSVPGPNAGV